MSHQQLYIITRTQKYMLILQISYQQFQIEKPGVQKKIYTWIIIKKTIKLLYFGLLNQNRNVENTNTCILQRI